MRKPLLSSEQAVDEIVAILQAGTSAPNEAVIRSWIEEDVESAKRQEEINRISNRHKEVIESIQKSAHAMLEGLAVLRGLEPWAKDQNSGECHLMYDVLPLEDPQRLESELRTLSTMGENHNDEEYRGARPWTLMKGPLTGRSVRLQLPAKKSTRPRMPFPILALHVMGLKRLKECGIHPSLGTGGNVARLGALFCTAAGFSLKQGESTKAARLARYDDELFAYMFGDPTVKILVERRDKSGTEQRPLYEPMWTECWILPNLDR